MENEKLSRKEALRVGQKVYWKVKPCPSGHIGWTRVGGGCVECQKQISNTYKRENKSTLREKRKSYLQSEMGKATMRKYMENGGAEKSAERQKRHRLKPGVKEKESEAHKKYMLRTKDERAKRRREHYANNKERIREKQNQYVRENRERFRLSRRESSRIYMREKRKTPDYKMIMTMRSFVARCTTRIKGGKKYRTKEILGYDHNDLKNHIESLWLDGMSWENHGKWHIDHIKPIKKFIDEGESDPRVINALSNLQPLWAFDNLSKGAK